MASLMKVSPYDQVPEVDSSDDSSSSSDWCQTFDQEGTPYVLEMEQEQEDEASSEGDLELAVVSLLPSRKQRLATIAEYEQFEEGGSLQSAALTFLLAYGLLFALVMGFVATVVARGVTAPTKLGLFLRNKKYL